MHAEVVEEPIQVPGKKVHVCEGLGAASACAPFKDLHARPLCLRDLVQPLRRAYASSNLMHTSNPEPQTAQHHPHTCLSDAL